MTKQEELQELKKKFRLSAVDMARLTGLHETTIRNYLRGKSEVPDSFTDKVRKALSVERREELDVQDVLRETMKGKVSVGELSRIVDRSKETIIKTIEQLNAEGYDIELDEATRLVELRREEVRRDFEPLQLKGLFKNHLKFGICSDKHYGSNFQQPTLINAAYHIMEEEGCSFVVDAGDLSDGHPRMHRGFGDVQWFNGDADLLTDYIINVHPKPKSGMKTYMLDSGSHDMIWKKIGGFNIVRAVCDKRRDLIQRAGDETILGANKQIHILARHPMGGVAYAKSYHAQKFGSSLLQWVIGRVLADTATRVGDVLPHVVVTGHYHLMLYLPEGGVHTYLAGCFQNQTPYMRDKGLFPDVGFWIVTLFFDDEGRINRSIHEPYRWSHLVKERDY